MSTERAEEREALRVSIRPDHVVAPWYDRKTRRCVHDSTKDGGCDLCQSSMRTNAALKRLLRRISR